jgi:membrane protein YdbS with pleckstrin-like domain
VQAVEPFRLGPRLARGTGRPETPPPAIADGRERRLDPRLIGVQRIGGLIAVAVVAVVFLAGIGIAFAADVPTWILGIALASWTLLVGTLAFAALAWPPLAWARASYRVDPEGLQIRRGVWWREMLRVPRSRVQHTDVSQGPVERTFGLSTLVVHTAGTHHASIQLEGLDLSTAETLRDFLIAGTEDAV